MFSDSFALRIAREQFIGIARDRIAHLDGDEKATSLKLITDALEMWKRQQADADGMIEIDPLIVGLLGMATLSADREVKLGEIAGGNTKRRFAVSDLKPWECAGFGVNCDADLFAWLAYGGYAPVSEAERMLGSGIAIALLLERDCMTMPGDSLAYAVRYLWIHAWTSAKVYFGEIGKPYQKYAEQLAAARIKSATKRADRAKMEHADWRSRAAATWRADPTIKRLVVASTIRDELARLAKPHKKPPSVATIEDAIKGVHEAVLVELSRANTRRTKNV
jgi:hypothetical protein